MDYRTKELTKASPFKGGLSEEVYRDEKFQAYINFGAPGSTYVGGYVGSMYRTRERDAYLEGFLRTQGLGPTGIAIWLSSVQGRHLMDSVDRKTTLKDFEGYVASAAGEAFEDVTVWSHPDHTGSLASSQRLRKRIFGHGN